VISRPIFYTANLPGKKRTYCIHVSRTYLHVVSYTTNKRPMKDGQATCNSVHFKIGEPPPISPYFFLMASVRLFAMYGPRALKNEIIIIYLVLKN